MEGSLKRELRIKLFAIEKRKKKLLRILKNKNLFINSDFGLEIAKDRTIIGYYNKIEVLIKDVII
jgi:hypothetical protein